MRIISRLLHMFTRGGRTAGGTAPRRGVGTTTATRRRGGIGSLIRRFLR